MEGVQPQGTEQHLQAEMRLLQVVRLVGHLKSINWFTLSWTYSGPVSWNRGRQQHQERWDNRVEWQPEMGDCRITMTALPGQNEAAEMWSGSLAKGRRRRAGAVGCAEARKELLKAPGWRRRWLTSWRFHSKLRGTEVIVSWWTSARRREGWAGGDSASSLRSRQSLIRWWCWSDGKQEGEPREMGGYCWWFSRLKEGSRCFEAWWKKNGWWESFTPKWRRAKCWRLKRRRCLLKRIVMVQRRRVEETTCTRGKGWSAGQWTRLGRQERTVA